jgi:hypothetical protein
MQKEGRNARLFSCFLLPVGPGEESVLFFIIIFVVVLGFELRASHFRQVLYHLSYSTSPESVLFDKISKHQL